MPPELVETFARGWALSRGAPAPVPDSGALRIETGAADEQRRYVFARAGDEIGAVARRVTGPHVRIKAAVDPDILAAMLPPHWRVERTGTMMTVDHLPQVPRALPADLLLAAEWQDDVYFVRFMDDAGDEAARGRMVIIEDWALHDRIRVADHRQRQGLGTALMTVLGAEAHRRGLRRGLLTATVEGRALYETMGWAARAPWTTAEIVAS